MDMQKENGSITTYDLANESLRINRQIRIELIIISVLIAIGSIVALNIY